MDLISLFLFTHENNEIKSPTKIYDFTVYLLQYQLNTSIKKNNKIYLPTLHPYIFFKGIDMGILFSNMKYPSHEC